MSQKKNVRQELPRGGAWNKGWLGCERRNPNIDPNQVVVLVHKGQPVNVSDEANLQKEDKKDS